MTLVNCFRNCFLSGNFFEAIVYLKKYFPTLRSFKRFYIIRTVSQCNLVDTARTRTSFLIFFFKIYSKLREVAATYKERVRMFTLGESYEGRKLYAVEVNIITTVINYNEYFRVINPFSLIVTFK